MRGVIELAPWTNLSGGASQDFIQPQREWPDIGSFADGTIFVDIKDRGGAPTLHLQTAIVEEDAYFVDFTGGIATTGTTLLVSRFATATTPMMRYLRWKVEAGASAWNLTFRILAVLKHG
ncbi:MAG: hypothetical protein AMXMBFR64_22210 [Myxococcales bacterium]